MKPPKKLLDGLVKHHLLPDEPPPIQNYAELELAIVHHLAACDETPGNVFWDDMEIVQSEGTYEALAFLYLQAVPVQAGVDDVTCKLDEKTQRITCTVKRAGKRTSASWVQDDDWVATKFVDLIYKVTTTKSGAFIDIGTGDQSRLDAYVSAAVARAFAEYKSVDETSRESFLTGESESSRHRFKDIKILPRSVYKRAFGQVKARFMRGDDPASFKSYVPDRATLVNTATRYADAMEAYDLIKARNLGTGAYAYLERWHHEPICPEETACILSMQDPRREIVFELPASHGCIVMGDHEQDLGNFMVVAQDGRWSIYAADEYLICAGEEVLSRLKPLLADIWENRNAAHVARIRDEYADPLIEELGFQSRQMYIGKSYQRDDKLHQSALVFQAEQKAPVDPVTFELRCGQFCPQVEATMNAVADREDEYSVLMWKDPPDGLQLTWMLSADDDFDAAAGAVCESIRRGSIWLAEEPADIPGWMHFYAEREQYLHAAAAALVCEERERASEYAQLAVADAREQRPRSLAKEIATLKALGLDVSEDKAEGSGQ